MSEKLKQRMLQAREAIKAKQYDKARKLLQGVDHPTAQEWLSKLDKVAPQKQKVVASGNKLGMVEYGLIGAIAVVLIVVIGFLVVRFLLPDESTRLRAQLTQTLNSEGITIQYPAGWNTNTEADTIVLASPEVDVNGDLETFPENGKGLMVIIDNNVEPNFDVRTQIQDSLEDLTPSTLIADVQYGNYSGVAFGMNLDSIPAYIVALRTNDDTLSIFIQLSANGTTSDPLLDEMIKTFNISPDAEVLECRVSRWWNGEAGQAVVTFLDTIETAGNTARMSLAPIVTDLQQQHRAFERMDYPPCLQEVRDYIVDGMENIIEGFQHFLASDDTLASLSLGDAETAFVSANTALRGLGFYGADTRLAVPSLLW